MIFGSVQIVGSATDILGLSSPFHIVHILAACCIFYPVLDFIRSIGLSGPVSVQDARRGASGICGVLSHLLTALCRGKPAYEIVAGQRSSCQCAIGGCICLHFLALYRQRSGFSGSLAFVAYEGDGILCLLHGEGHSAAFCDPSDAGITGRLIIGHSAVSRILDVGVCQILAVQRGQFQLNQVARDHAIGLLIL